MRLKISERNSKLGKLHNISLTPGASCRPGVPCLREGCYAMQAYRRYPATRNAWDSNLRFYREDPRVFFEEFDSWLTLVKPKLFRMFVGGDFPDEGYLERYTKVTNDHPSTKFLAFTKRYGYNYSGVSENSTVILSCWPGLELPKHHMQPWAWLEDDPRRLKGMTCEMKCDSPCGYKCWGLGPDDNVIFPKH